MLRDDGDIVRALGFLTMNSAWVEEDVDELLRVLEPLQSFDAKIQRWPISRKLIHAKVLVSRLPESGIEDLAEDLEQGLDLFDRRNQIVHGRIYEGFDKVIYIQSGRADIPTQRISSAELYELAQSFDDYRSSLIGPKLRRLPQALQDCITPL